MALLRVNNLTKSYGKLVALDRVSFQVGEGEIFAYLGPNGAGKTTTINILSGLLHRDSGEVEICGHDLDSEPVAIKRSIGVVPEESNLYPELTCARNLDYLGELYGLSGSARRRKSEELLALFGLEDKAKVDFRGLSKGLKRRLTIAAALVHEPEVLFLDEPTSGLDVPSARDLRHLLAQINRQGTTVLLTTHNMAEAEELAQRLTILIRGKVVTSGTPAEIRRLATQRERLEVVFSQAVKETEILQACPTVVKVSVMEPGVILAVADLDKALHEIMSFAGKAEVRVVSVSSMPPSLEDAFVSLLESHKSNGSRELS